MEEKDFQYYMDLLMKNINKQYSFTDIPLPEFITEKKSKGRQILELALSTISKYGEDVKEPVLKGGDVVGLGLEGTIALTQGLRDSYKAKLEEMARKKQMDLAERQMIMEEEYRRKQLELQQAQIRSQYLQILQNKEIAIANMEITKLNTLSNIVNNQFNFKLAQEQLKLSQEKLELDRLSTTSEIAYKEKLLNIEAGKTGYYNALAKYYEVVAEQLSKINDKKELSEITEKLEIPKNVDIEGNASETADTLKNITKELNKRNEKKEIKNIPKKEEETTKKEDTGYNIIRNLKIGG